MADPRATRAARDVATPSPAPAPGRPERVASAPRAFRAACAVVAALFFLGAVVQWNDPDPLRWMLIYLAAAVASLLAATGRTPWPLSAAVAVVALLWAATLAPGVLGRVRMGELVEAWEMKDDEVEAGRETYGLLLIFAWASVLTATGLRGRRRARTSRPRRR